MHNSYHILDLLRKMNKNQICLERRNPHRSVEIDSSVHAGSGDFMLAEKWHLVNEANNTAAAADLEDFLNHLKIDVDDKSSATVTLKINDLLTARAFRLSAAPDKIIIEGGDYAGLWAGISRFEREIRQRRGKFMAPIDITVNAAWQFQISQVQWGANYSVPHFSKEYLPDESFRLMAHYGINSMMIYGDMLCYVNSRIFPELNAADYTENIRMLKDAAKRAEQYGIKFTYVVVGPKLQAAHPLFKKHPDARGTGIGSHRPDRPEIFTLCASYSKTLDFYTEFLQHLFSEVPQLAGIIAIVANESFYHCKMSPKPSTQCPRCVDREGEDIVADIITACSAGIRKAGSKSFIAAWPYQLGGWKNPDGLKLIEKLPDSCVFMDQVDKNEIYRKTNYRKKIWDYSIDYSGPSKIFVRRANAAKARNLPVFAKTETAIGLEVFQYPYVPALQKLAAKWQVLRDIKPAGVHQSWLFFGMFGSRAEELGYWAAYDRDIPADEYLRLMAVRDFGPENTNRIISAWENMSEAVSHIPCLTLYKYYKGPSFLGPCHPLLPDRNMKIPEIFSAKLYYHQEGCETFAPLKNNPADILVMNSLPENKCQVIADDGVDCWQLIIDEYRTAARYAEKSWDLLTEAKYFCKTASDTRNLEEEILLTELIFRTFTTCANTVEFLRERDDRDMRKMKKFAELEKQNALASMHIYAAAPWLDPAMRLDGEYSSAKQMIEEKIKIIDAFIKND